MVEWHPVSGFLPPLTESDWQTTFKKYQAYPEFRIKNPEMDITGFKSIFWLEFTHRLWGRLLAIIFFIPLVFFILKKQLPKTLTTRFIALFILGGAQGVLGWFMVKSGLAEQADVSQYRLVAHLLLAFLLYGWTLWMALDLIPHTPDHKPPNRYSHALSALLILLLITVISGGFVAGTDAGLIYNSYPMMGESLIPKDLFTMTPWVKNLFENIVTIQFTHRLLTALTLVFTLVIYTMIIHQEISRQTQLAAHSLLFAVSLQFILGIATLLFSVPVILGIAHQAGALLLFTAMLWLRHTYRT